MMFNQVRFGSLVGVPTPVNTALVTMLANMRSDAHTMAVKTSLVEKVVGEGKHVKQAKTVSLKCTVDEGRFWCSEGHSVKECYIFPLALKG